MEGEDEIIFSADYKGMKAGERYDLSKAGESDVAALLVKISDYIEPFAFEFLGIKYGEMEKEVEGGIERAGGPSAFLKSNKKRFEEIVGAYKKELRPLAESAFLNILLKKSGKTFKPRLTTRLAPERIDEEEGVVFIAKYRDWIAIKKTSPKKEHEVGALLGSIDNTLIRKSWDFAGERLKEGKKRKSYSALVEAVEKEGKGLLEELVAVGYPPYPDLNAIIKAYPDVKIPKPRGRLPKG